MASPQTNANNQQPEQNYPTIFWIKAWQLFCLKKQATFHNLTIRLKPNVSSEITVKPNTAVLKLKYTCLTVTVYKPVQSMLIWWHYEWNLQNRNNITDLARPAPKCNVLFHNIPCGHSNKDFWGITWRLPLPEIFMPAVQLMAFSGTSITSVRLFKMSPNEYILVNSLHIWLANNGFLNTF